MSYPTIPTFWTEKHAVVLILIENSLGMTHRLRDLRRQYIPTFLVTLSLTAQMRAYWITTSALDQKSSLEPLNISSSGPSGLSLSNDPIKSRHINLGVKVLVSVSQLANGSAARHLLVVLSPEMYSDGIDLIDLDDLARALRDADVYLHMILDPSHNMNPSRRLLYQSAYLQHHNVIGAWFKVLNADRERYHFWFAAATFVELPVDSNATYPLSHQLKSISSDSLVSSINADSPPSCAAGVSTESYLADDGIYLTSNLPDPMALVPSSQQIPASTRNTGTGVTHSAVHVPYTTTTTTTSPNFINATVVRPYIPSNDGGHQGGGYKSMSPIDSSLPSSLNSPSHTSPSVHRNSQHTGFSLPVDTYRPAPILSNPLILNHGNLAWQPLRTSTDEPVSEDAFRHAGCDNSRRQAFHLSSKLVVRDETKIVDDDAIGAISNSHAWRPQHPATDRYIGSSSPDFERSSPSLALGNTTEWNPSHRTSQQIEPISIMASPSTFVQYPNKSRAVNSSPSMSSQYWSPWSTR
ncbi:hypothetical protein PILCRDRAFT_3615 [Piloderma croceum F 1598]|uniref:Uncharacterized protein n=1 Tax=Piloderma croceum (strain F 1598) TaxID=765440 RepID=A0A0C3GB90_PILCF|nr:hypothetical protein PILCRDRAFT_3615 [Piloderma croceum F 1598]